MNANTADTPKFFLRLRTFLVFALLTPCLLVGLSVAISEVGAQTPKPHKLDPKEVAKNELIDQKFLKPYKAGIQLLQQGKYDDAIGMAKQALKERPRSGRARLVMASAYKMKQMYNDAIQYFQEAANIFDPKREAIEKTQALYNIAFCYEILGQRPNAIAAWQIYVTFASGHFTQNNQLEFAKQRIQDLQQVKGPPNK